MPYQWTPPLPVKSVSTSSSKLVYEIRSPYKPDLFIDTVIITRLSAAGISGAIQAGADASAGGGIARVHVDQTTFADLRAQAAIPMSVKLQYEIPHLNVVNISQRRGEEEIAAQTGSAE